MDPKGFGFGHGGLSGLHGVDDVFFYLRKLFFRKRASEKIYSGGADLRALALGDDLDTLGGGVCPLVELAGEILYGESGHAPGVKLAADQIQLRLGQHGFNGVVKKRRGDVLHIVAIYNAQLRKGLDMQQAANILLKASGLVGKSFFLFNKNPVYHHVTSPNAFIALAPMSRRKKAFSKCTCSVRA